MAKPGDTGLTRIIKASGYSMKGFSATWQHESAFRQEALLALVMLPAGLWLGQNAIEYALLIGSLLLVLIVELINSAIEAVVDRHGDEYNELAGRAKDQGSAAVFVALLMVLLIWGSIALQRFMA
jgi:diacylglycerol kinase (ATP)